jgi:hypothetical protein
MKSITNLVLPLRDGIGSLKGAYTVAIFFCISRKPIFNKMQDDLVDAYKYFLYLDPSIHVQEDKLVRNAGLESFILVLDVRKSPEKLPEYLNKLPALLDKSKMLAYRGDTCMQHLVSIKLPPEHLKRLEKLQAKKARLARTYD